MGHLCTVQSNPRVRLLDPAAGTGTLAAAACEALAISPNPPQRIELVAYELNKGLQPALNACFSYLSSWLNQSGIELVTRLEMADFVQDNAGAIEGEPLPVGEAFDIVICNPPYSKLPKSDPRVQACLAIVHGQPNLYGLFMAIGAAMLGQGGRFVFITPRSFASGPYFRQFRQWFFERIQLTDLHTFESRTKAFDEVLQETMITAGDRVATWQETRGGSVRISVSDGAADLGQRQSRVLPVSSVLREDCGQSFLYLPTHEEDDRVRELVGTWTGSLHAYGWEVSTGPVVGFRATQWLLTEAAQRFAPLLWLQHIHPMSVQWPLEIRKAQFIADTDESAHLLLENTNYVVVRRFSAKEEPRRLTAAPYLAARFGEFARVGLENHLNYIHCPSAGNLTDDEAFGLAALLNSRLMDTWFRIGSGNTQVSATELRALPLPALEVIRRVGTKVRLGADVDTVVEEEVSYAR